MNVHGQGLHAVSVLVVTHCSTLLSLAYVHVEIMHNVAILQYALTAIFHGMHSVVLTDHVSSSRNDMHVSNSTHTHFLSLSLG